MKTSRKTGRNVQPSTVEATLTLSLIASPLNGGLHDDTAQTRLGVKRDRAARRKLLSYARAQQFSVT